MFDVRSRANKSLPNESNFRIFSLKLLDDILRVIFQLGYNDRVEIFFSVEKHLLFYLEGITNMGSLGYFSPPL